MSCSGGEPSQWTGPGLREPTCPALGWQACPVSAPALDPRRHSPRARPRSAPCTRRTVSSSTSAFSSLDCTCAEGNEAESGCVLQGAP